MSSLRQGEPGHGPYMVEQRRRAGFQHRDAGQLHRFLPGQRLGEGALPGRQSRRRQETDGSGRRTRGGLRGRGGGASPAAPRNPRFADWGCLRGHPSLPDDASECL